MRLLGLLPVVFIAIACEAKVPAPKPAPDSDLCEDMCNYLTQLGCEEAQPLYDSELPGPRGIPNETCVQWCVKQQAKGLYLNPRCVMQAKSCLEIEELRARNCSP